MRASRLLDRVADKSALGHVIDRPDVEALRRMAQWFEAMGAFDGLESILERTCGPFPDEDDDGVAEALAPIDG